MNHIATTRPPSNGTPGPRTAVDPAIEERFRPFETAPTGMLLVDREGTILASNACLDRIFGYDPGELRGMLRKS
jgi:PAS domain-containing protein